MRAFAELLDDLGAEGRKVLGSAAGDQAVVHHHLLIDDVGAGVLQILADGGPAGQGASLGQAGVDQDPGRVADRPDRLARLGEGADEAGGLLVDPQLVGIGHATGQHQGVVVARRGVGEGAVDPDLLAGRQVVVALDLALLGRDDLDLGAGRL